MLTKSILTTTTLFLAIASPAIAQPVIDSDWFTVDGGGTQTLTGGDLALLGTIGQPDAGTLTGAGGIEVQGGFWFAGVPYCDSIDFNNNSSFFDPEDIDAFLSVYGEGPCIPDTATCNDIDFNNDGSVFDPCDIDSFLLVFSEGPCTLCGS
ncbi:MAG: hypothetical protein U0640_06125 [Phycisphaerales bacterium]